MVMHTGHLICQKRWYTSNHLTHSNNEPINAHISLWPKAPQIGSFASSRWLCGNVGHILGECDSWSFGMVGSLGANLQTVKKFGHEIPIPKTWCIRSKIIVVSRRIPGLCCGLIVHYSAFGALCSIHTAFGTYMNRSKLKPRQEAILGWDDNS